MDHGLGLVDEVTYKRQIKILESIEINEYVIQKMAKELLLNIEDSIEQATKDIYYYLNKENLKKGYKRKKEYYIRRDIPSDLSYKTFIPNDDLLNSGSGKRFLEKTKKNSFYIKAKCNYKFFFGSKPPLKEIAEQYRIFKTKYNRKLSKKDNLTYEDIKKGKIPWFRNSRNINIYHNFTKLLAKMWKKEFLNVKFSITRHDWKFRMYSDYCELKEKGTDCKIILEMLDCKNNSKNNYLCLIGNDSDFYPLMKKLNSEKKHFNFNSLPKNYPILIQLDPYSNVSKILKEFALVIQPDWKYPDDYLRCFGYSRQLASTNEEGILYKMLLNLELTLQDDRMYQSMEDEFEDEFGPMDLT